MWPSHYIRTLAAGAGLMLLAAAGCRKQETDPPVVEADENAILERWAPYTGRFKTRCILSQFYYSTYQEIDTTVELNVSLTSLPGQLIVAPFYYPETGQVKAGTRTFDAREDGTADRHGFYTCRFSADSFNYRDYNYPTGSDDISYSATYAGARIR